MINNWARRAAYGGGGLTAAGALTAGLLYSEIKLARRLIPRSFVAPMTGTDFGDPADEPLRLALLGDSSAAGVGCDDGGETMGALLAERLADEGYRVALDVVAVIGARSADLHDQVARALLSSPDVAVISIGTNDVTHFVPIRQAVSDLGRAVRRLRRAGCRVVVVTCPDLGTVRPVLPPLRWVAGRLSHHMTAAQVDAVRRAGGVPVDVRPLLAPLFRKDTSLFCADRFHPSATGYRQIADSVLPYVQGAAALAKIARRTVQSA